MKVFIGILLLVFAMTCVSADWEKMKTIRDECRAKHDITDDFWSKDFKPNMAIPKLKCFIACMMTKTGSMANGKIDVEKSQENLTRWMPNIDEETRNRIETCAKDANEATDECDVAATYAKCTLGFIALKV